MEVLLRDDLTMELLNIVPPIVVYTEGRKKTIIECSTNIIADRMAACLSMMDGIAEAKVYCRVPSIDTDFVWFIRR